MFIDTKIEWHKIEWQIYVDSFLYTQTDRSLWEKENIL